jgi:hypothetical protein
MGDSRLVAYGIWQMAYGSLPFAIRYFFSTVICRSTALKTRVKKSVSIK